MMVKIAKGKIEVGCDVCGVKAYRHFQSTVEAAQWERRNRWTKTRFGTLWAHRCPSCKGKIFNIVQDKASA